MLVAIAVIPTATARLEFSTDNLHADGQVHDLHARVIERIDWLIGNTGTRVAAT